MFGCYVCFREGAVQIGGTNWIWKLSTLSRSSMPVCVHFIECPPMKHVIPGVIVLFFFSICPVKQSALGIYTSTGPQHQRWFGWIPSCQIEWSIPMALIIHGEHPPPPFHDHPGYISCFYCCICWSNTKDHHDWLVDCWSIFVCILSFTYLWRNSQPNKPPWLSCRRKRSIPGGGFDTVVRLHVLSAKLGWNTCGKRDDNGTQKIFRVFRFCKNRICPSAVQSISCACRPCVCRINHYLDEILGFELK